MNINIAELRADCERILAERYKNPAPYNREAALARQTLAVLDRLERYKAAWTAFEEAFQKHNAVLNPGEGQ